MRMERIMLLEALSMMHVRVSQVVRFDMIDSISSFLQILKNHTNVNR